MISPISSAQFWTNYERQNLDKTISVVGRDKIQNLTYATSLILVITQLKWIQLKKYIH